MSLAWISDKIKPYLTVEPKKKKFHILVVKILQKQMYIQTHKSWGSSQIYKARTLKRYGNKMRVTHRPIVAVSKIQPAAVLFKPV